MYVYVYVNMNVSIHIHKIIVHTNTSVAHARPGLRNTLQHNTSHCSRLHTLQHTAMSCSTLQHIATYCSIVQHTKVHNNTLQHSATLASQRTATHWNVAIHPNALQHAKNTLHHIAAHCNSQKHTATHRNTLPRTATHYNAQQRNATLRMPHHVFAELDFKCRERTRCVIWCCQIAINWIIDFNATLSLNQ